MKVYYSGRGYSKQTCLFYILAKSSNRPPAFYYFSSKRKMTWLLFLHLEIDRRVMYPWQWRYWQNVQQFMITWIVVPPFSKFAFWHNLWVMTFWNNPISHAKRFLSRAKHILNTKVLKWTLHLHETRYYWLKCQKLPHHLMQFLVNFKI